MITRIQFLPDEDLRAKFVFGSMSESYDWGLQTSGILDIHKSLRGAGVTVAVLDTGVPDHSDLAANQLPGFDCTDENNPADQQGHGCLLGSERVLTSIHGVSTIEDVFNTTQCEAIELNTHEGTEVRMVLSSGVKVASLGEHHHAVMRPLKAVHKLRYKGSVHVVSTRNSQVTLTPWHPVYRSTSRRGGEFTIKSTRADALSVGDVLMSATDLETNTSKISLPFRTRYVCRFCGREARLGLRKQCKGCNKCSWHDGPVTSNILVDEDLAFWIGLVASDGHLSATDGGVSFCGNDIRLIQLFESLTLKLFNRASTRCASRGVCHRTQVSDVDVNNLLSREFGLTSNKSLTLRFPQIFNQVSRSVFGAFIAGMIEGDGNITNDWRIRLTTGSLRLAQELSETLRFHGIKSHYNTLRNTNHGKLSTTYQVRISPDSSITRFLRFKSGVGAPSPRKHQSESITSIKVQHFDGYLYDFTIDGTKNYIANGIVVSNTHCAGIVAACQNGVGIVGVAPDAKFIPIKVLGNDGHGAYEFIANGIKKAVEVGAKVLSMSLGNNQQPPEWFHDVVKDAFAKGLIMIAAAGNDGGDVNYPAKYDEVIAVAAIGKDGHLASFSSRGDKVDFSAAGTDIYSTYLHQGFACLSGTSQACPFIAGCCALLISYERSHGRDIANGHEMLTKLAQLCDASGRIGATTKTGDLGFGVPSFANWPVN